MDLEKVRVFFVISDKYEDEKETSEFMQEAYSSFAAYCANMKWLREQDRNDYEFLKTDFIVFEEFTGEFYKEVNKTKSVIVGPICILACLTEGKPIPNLNWPLLNISLQDCIISCSGLSKEERQKAANKIQMMAGHFNPSLNENSTVLITDTVRSQKYSAAALMGIKVVLPSWLDSIWEASQNKIIRWDDERFEIHTCKPFHKLTICSTGLSPNTIKRIKEVVESNGGIYSSVLNIKITDVLVCQGGSGAKFKAARKQKIDCVLIDWILDSAEKGYAQSVTDYAIKKTSTPVKENQFEPNFSTISAIAGPSCITQSILNESIANTQSFFTKPTSVPKSVELVDSLNIKKAKRAGSFLDGCSIYLVGFSSEHQEKLCKILNFSGSTRYDSFSERITHVVVGDPKCHEMKVLATKDLHCALVSVEWVLNSMEAGRPVSEENFLISFSSSPSLVSKSPLIKKGLRLLKADVSTLENEPVKRKTPEKTLVGIDDEIRKQYLNPFGTGTEDTLAAVLAQNNFDTYNYAGDVKRKSVTNTSTVHNKTSTLHNNTSNTTVNKFFSNLNFIIVDFEPDVEEFLVKTINDLGGLIVPKNFKGVPDYAVVPVHLTTLRQTASEIVTDLWIHESLSKKCLVEPIEYYHKPCIVENSIALKDTVISISGYEIFEKMYLKTLCENLGACVQDSMARVTRPERNLLPSTHLVSFEDSGKKYDAGVKWGIYVINKDWVLKCASTNSRVQESDYLIGKSKENFENSKLEQFKSPPSTSFSRSNTSFTLNISMNKSITNVSQQVRDEEEEALANISKLVRTEATNISVTSLQANAESSNTPITSRQVNNNSSVCTPVNRVSISPIASQITPVDKLIKRANLSVNSGNCKTPSPKRKRDDDIDTPDSPYGAFIQNPPPKELRKKFAKWINGFPDFKKREECLSTPFSELKRRAWKKVCPNYVPPKKPNFDDPDAEENISFTNNDIIKDKININDVDKDDDKSEDLSSENLRTCSSQDTPQNKLINEKLRLLEDMVTSSGGGRGRRSSIKQPTPVANIINNEIESQPFSVAWDDNIETGPMSMGSNNASRVFMISGIVDDKRVELVQQIEELGGSVSELSQFDPESTHLLVEKLAKNEKFLCSMASGKWILHPSYIRDSIAAGKFLDYEEYEYGNPKSSKKIQVGKQSLVQVKWVHYWRTKNAECGYGPFHNIKALFVTPKKDALARLIEAGGGMVVKTEPPFDDNIFATHCFSDKSALTSKAKELITLAKRGIYCLNSTYLGEFLQGNENIHDQIPPYLSKYYTEKP